MSGNSSYSTNPQNSYQERLRLAHKEAGAFIRVPVIWSEMSLSLEEQSLAGHLLKHACFGIKNKDLEKQKGWFWITIKRMCEWAGGMPYNTGRKRFPKLLKNLESKGILLVKTKRASGSKYTGGKYIWLSFKGFKKQEQ